MDRQAPRHITQPLPQEETIEVLVPELGRQRARHLLLEGPARRIELTPESPVAVLGRDEHCSLILIAACTSREHARIVRSESGLYYLEDCSTNGTILVAQGTGASILRRGQRTPLTSTGYIGLGAIPHPGSAWTVRFRVD